MLNISYPDPEILHTHRVMSAIGDQKGAALSALLQTLAQQEYHFTAVTPLTHERVLARSQGVAQDIRDVFGWNLPFEQKILSPLMFDVMHQANVLSRMGDYFRSNVRVSSLGNDLFLHSSFPTNDAHSVFFGPDTYRFSRFISQSLNQLALAPALTSRGSPLRILDVGCGSGAGGVAVVRSLASHQPFQLLLNDVNPVALDYAAVCTDVAGIPATLLHRDFLSIQGRQFDMIIANPPFIQDSEKRLYRDGGSRLGLDLSLRIAKHAIALLAPGGHLLMYTGVAMDNDNTNPLLRELIPLIATNQFYWSYDEIDPDIFGEELEKPEYYRATRIAAVGLRVTRLS